MLNDVPWLFTFPSCVDPGFVEVDDFGVVLSPNVRSGRDCFGRAGLSRAVGKKTGWLENDALTFVVWPEFAAFEASNYQSLCLT